MPLNNDEQLRAIALKQAVDVNGYTPTTDPTTPETEAKGVIIIAEVFYNFLKGSNPAGGK